MYSDGFNPLLRFSVLLPGSGRKGVCVSFKTHLKQEQEYGMEIIEIAKLLPQSNRVLLFAFFRLLFAMNILPPSRLFTHLLGLAGLLQLLICILYQWAGSKKPVDYRCNLTTLRINLNTLNVACDAPPHGYAARLLNKWWWPNFSLPMSGQPKTFTPVLP